MSHLAAVILICVFALSTAAEPPPAELPGRWDEATGPIEFMLRLPEDFSGEQSLVMAGEELLGVRAVAADVVEFYVTKPGGRPVQSSRLKKTALAYARVVMASGALMPPNSSDFYWKQPHLFHLAGCMLVVVNEEVVLVGPSSAPSIKASGVTLLSRFVSQLGPAPENDLSSRFLPLVAHAALRGEAGFRSPGPIRLAFRFTGEADGVPRPLMATGRMAAGNLLYWLPQPDGRVRIGLRHDGAATVESEPLTIREGTNEIVVSTGALFPPVGMASPWVEADVGVLRRWLWVQLNGQVVLNQSAEFHPSTPDRIIFGANVFDSSPARRYFDGWCEKFELVDPIAILVDRTRIAGPLRSPSAEWQGWPGPLRLAFRIPRDRPGQAEPLLTTGVTAGGDFVYVKYEGPRHLRIGFDHWGGGGPLSEPIEIDPDATQNVVINLGSLWPPIESPFYVENPELRAWREQLRIIVNGRVILSERQEFHPATPAQIVVRENKIGGSSSSREFTGQLLHIQHVPVSTLSPVTVEAR